MVFSVEAGDHDDEPDMDDHDFDFEMVTFQNSKANTGNLFDHGLSDLDHHDEEAGPTEIRKASSPTSPSSVHPVLPVSPASKNRVAINMNMDTDSEHSDSDESDDSNAPDIIMPLQKARKG